MKALSLHQPWATVIAFGAKAYETRHWGTRYRGPLAIHAAKHRNLDDEQGLIDELDCLYGWHDLPAARDLPRGAVVAVATLAGCLRMTETRILAQSELERDVGNWLPGRWAWHLTDVRRMAAPVPVRGEQGLFHIPDALLLPVLRSPEGEGG